MAKRGLTPGAPDFDSKSLRGASSTVGFLGIDRPGKIAFPVIGAMLFAVIIASMI